VRPYVDLVSYHEKFKEALQQMEAEEPSSPSLEELRCYVDFAERRVLPNYTRIREATSSDRPSILFDDLWYLLSPGDLIFIPGKTMIDAAKGTAESRRHRPGPPPDPTMFSAVRESPWHQSMSLAYVPTRECLMAMLIFEFRNLESALYAAPCS
jgi:hypothetical protein